MKHMNDSGTETKSKKTSEPEQDRYLSELASQELDPTEVQSLTFEDAKDALSILISQIGSPIVRKAHRGRIMGYLILQERRLRTLERRAKNWGYDDETEHCLALAKYWDRVE
jgi:hypothetical protein